MRSSGPLRLLQLLFQLCLAATASTQESHWQIQVDGYGLVRLSYGDLEEALADPNRVYDVKTKSDQANDEFTVCMTKRGN